MIVVAAVLCTYFIATRTPLRRDSVNKLTKNIKYAIELPQGKWGPHGLCSANTGLFERRREYEGGPMNKFWVNDFKVGDIRIDVHGQQWKVGMQDKVKVWIAV